MARSTASMKEVIIHGSYECNPLSFIIEQAGGMATDGHQRIMDIEPTAIHQQTPIYIGSKENVSHVMDFLHEFAGKEEAEIEI